MAIKKIDLLDEIKKWKEAIWGKEVRAAQVSAYEKIQESVNGSIDAVTAAADDVAAAAEKVAASTSNADRAAGRADVAADVATTAAENATAAARTTEETRQDILARLAAGEFKGDKGATGQQGPQGEQGKSGVNIPAASRVYIYTDDANNCALHCVYDDALYTDPPFLYDTTTGAIKWQYDDGK